MAYTPFNTLYHNICHATHMLRALLYSPASHTSARENNSHKKRRSHRTSHCIVCDAIYIVHACESICTYKRIMKYSYMHVSVLDIVHTYYSPLLDLLRGACHSPSERIEATENALAIGECVYVHIVYKPCRLQKQQRSTHECIRRFTRVFALCSLRW